MKEVDKVPNLLSIRGHNLNGVLRAVKHIHVIDTCCFPRRPDTSPRKKYRFCPHSRISFASNTVELNWHLIPNLECKSQTMNTILMKFSLKKTDNLWFTQFLYKMYKCTCYAKGIFHKKSIWNWRKDFVSHKPIFFAEFEENIAA